MRGQTAFKMGARRNHMGRRKITDEAEEANEEETEPTDEEEADGDERHTLTQRMPSTMVDEVDDFAERRGMSRNAAINFLVREALDEQ